MKRTPMKRGKPLKRGRIASSRKPDWLKKKRFKPAKRTRSRRKAVKQLDAAARLATFERDGHKCVRCSKESTIQWSHVLGREHLATRWELDNALTLCAGCHIFWWHKQPALSGPWFQKNWPERYERILALYNAGGKVNPVELAAQISRTGF